MCGFLNLRMITDPTHTLGRKWLCRDTRTGKEEDIPAWSCLTWMRWKRGEVAKQSPMMFCGWILKVKTSSSKNFLLLSFLVISKWNEPVTSLWPQVLLVVFHVKRHPGHHGRNTVECEKIWGEESGMQSARQWFLFTVSGSDCFWQLS